MIMSIWLVSNMLCVPFFIVSNVLCSNRWWINFVLDVIGVMTGMSAEREYIKDGKITKMVIIELTDHR
jgi:hypothetical protein